MMPKTQDEQWIPLHTSLLDHTKLKRLARKLGLQLDPATRASLMGNLVSFWLHIKQTPLPEGSDGTLASYSAEDLADDAGWAGDPEVFSEAMVYAGFLYKTDDGYRVHEYDEHFCRERKREKWRDQKAAQRGKSSDVLECPQMSTQVHPDKRERESEKEKESVTPTDTPNPSSTETTEIACSARIAQLAPSQQADLLDVLDALPFGVRILDTEVSILITLVEDYPQVNWRAETAKMVDWWTKKPGKAKKPAWARRLDNWVRRSKGLSKKDGTSGPPGRPKASHLKIVKPDPANFETGIEVFDKLMKLLAADDAPKQAYYAEQGVESNFDFWYRPMQPTGLQDGILYIDYPEPRLDDFLRDFGEKVRWFLGMAAKQLGVEKPRLEFRPVEQEVAL